MRRMQSALLSSVLLLLLLRWATKEDVLPGRRMPKKKDKIGQADACQGVSLAEVRHCRQTVWAQTHSDDCRAQGLARASTLPLHLVDQRTNQRKVTLSTFLLAPYRDFTQTVHSAYSFASLGLSISTDKVHSWFARKSKCEVRYKFVKFWNPPLELHINHSLHFKVDATFSSGRHHCRHHQNVIYSYVFIFMQYFQLMLQNFYNFNIIPVSNARIFV